MKNVRAEMRTGFQRAGETDIPTKHDDVDIPERHTATRRLCAGTYLDD
jgi:hypothetical protein